MKSRQTAAKWYMTVRVRLVPAVTLALLAGAAAAQIYECTNAKGVKEYSHFCPPGTVQQRQITKGGDEIPPDAGGAGASKPIPQQEADFRKRQLERQEAEAKAGQEKTKAEEAERNCNQARSHLRTIQEGYRMSRIDPDTGERVSYSDEDRATEAERAQKQIEQWCK